MEPNSPSLLNSAADTPADSEVASRGSGTRFLHAGGSRPLEGYTIKRGVGQGGFGEIYYALSDSGKEVALKLIRRNLDVELRGIRQCLNLKHPNLLNLFDIRQDEKGDTWVVMEYVSGLPLQEAIDSQPDGMPLDEVLAWIHGIGEGVAYLHDHGIVHRDLKPANIFSDDGVVKVGDYGLSKFISCSRRSGHTESIGTVHYMAPEVANGRYGKELDVYALGIILYEMLTGRVPFDGESIGEVLMKHLTAQPDVSMLSEPFGSIVLKAMQKDPEKRYRSANELLADIPLPHALLPGSGRLPSGNREKPSKSNASQKPTASKAIPAQKVRADEEPILRELGKICGQIQQWWNGDSMTPARRIAFVLLVLILWWAFLNILLPSQIVWVVFFILAILYIGYRGLRWMFLPSVPILEVVAEDRPELAKTIASPPVEGERVRADSKEEAEVSPVKPQRSFRHEKVSEALVIGSPRDRFLRGLGSLVLAPVIALAMTILAVLVGSICHNEPRIEQFVWIFFVCVAGSWAILIPSRIWEGTQGETLIRRLILLFLGLGVGALAAGMAGLFQVDFPFDKSLSMSIFSPPQRFYDMDGRPLFPAFAASFGTLFFLCAWWKQANPLRRTRLSLWYLTTTLFLAVVAAVLWHFPQPWLPAVAVAISATVQLSSPWIPPQDRA